MIDKEKIIRSIKALDLVRINNRNVRSLQENDIVIIMFDENHRNYIHHRDFLLIEQVIENDKKNKRVILKRVYPDNSLGLVKKNDIIVRDYYNIYDDYLGFISYRCASKIKLILLCAQYGVIT